MLATVTVSMWSARKYDRKVTEEVLEQHSAAKDSGRWNKKLLAGDSLTALASLGGQIRKAFYKHTVPWLDDGTRILSTTGYEAFTKEMRSFRDVWDEKVKAFEDAYPAMVAEARVKLNGMFDERDYPSPDRISRKFGFDVTFMPVPEAQDFRASVSDAQAQMIRQSIERATKEVIANAQRDVFERIAEVVQHMVDKLSNYNPDAGKTREAIASGEKKNRFSDSVVENIRDLVGLLPALNVANDSALNAMTARLSAQLCRYDADTLRDDGVLRRMVASQASAIMADVSAFLG
jgi:hypothetical protein